MALRSPNLMTSDGSPDVQTFVKQLQALKSTFAVGAGASTNIPITGIKTTATLVSVIELDFTLGEGAPNTRTWTATVDRTATTSVTSAGNIQCTASTAAKLLAVTYFNHD